MLRPERISLSRQKRDQALAATVEDITFLGNNIHVATRVAGETPVSVRVPFGSEVISGIERGMPVWLSFEAGAAHVFVA